MAVKLCRGVEKQQQFIALLPLWPLWGSHGRSSLLQKQLTGIVRILLTFTRVDALRSTSGGSGLAPLVSVLYGCRCVVRWILISHHRRTNCYGFLKRKDVNRIQSHKWLKLTEKVAGFLRVIAVVLVLVSRWVLRPLHKGLGLVSVSDWIDSGFGKRPVESQPTLCWQIEKKRQERCWVSSSANTE